MLEACKVTPTVGLTSPLNAYIGETPATLDADVEYTFSKLGRAIQYQRVSVPLVPYSSEILLKLRDDSDYYGSHITTNVIYPFRVVGVKGPTTSIISSWE